MVIQRYTRQDFVPHHHKVVSKNIQRNVRPVKKEQVDIIKKIEKFTGIKKFFNYYLGFGGAGDAVLTLSACWNDPNAQAVFFGNSSSIPLIKDLFATFGITSIVMANIMGTPMANTVFDRLKKLPTFKQSAHLADGLYYEDWRNEGKYIPRITNYIPEWRLKFGLLNKKLVAIAPSGSFRDSHRQRYLSKQEYKTLARKYLEKGYDVYGIGSDRDLREYHFNEKGVWWATNRILRNWEGTKNHLLKDMLQIINSAKEVISVDTCWKTYSLLAGIPTTVIQTRWNGQYRPYGVEATDWIFLNKNIWSAIKIVKIEDLI